MLLLKFLSYLPSSFFLFIQSFPLVWFVVSFIILLFQCLDSLIWLAGLAVQTNISVLMPHRCLLEKNPTLLLIHIPQCPKHALFRD